MIGLIFGDTDFPKEILKTVKKKKIRYLIVDLSKTKKFKKDKQSYAVSIGQFGKIINILKENNCKKVLFAGKIARPNFTSLRLDFKGIYYMPSVIRASKIGDAAIIKSIINILANEGIKVISSIYFNPELSLKKGNYTKTKLNKNDNNSIKKAQNYFNKINSLDHIQALVIKDEKIIVIVESDCCWNRRPEEY